LKHREKVDAYIKSAAQLLANKETKGFKNIVETLQLIVSEGAKSCSCKMCERIGDFIITLDSPESMSLEHTDLSFNQLCDLIRREHRHHPSQSAVIKEHLRDTKDTDK
jgi:hypothetical protein